MTTFIVSMVAIAVVAFIVYKYAFEQGKKS